MIWLTTSRFLALGAFVLGLAAFPAAITGDPWSWVWFAVGIPMGFYLDLVSVLLLGFVGLLGWIVTGYSLTNLRGRAQPERTGAALFIALVSLLVTVSGASLAMMAVGWTASGLAVAALVARSGTPRARAAAGVMRRTLLTGDVFLFGGVLAGLIVLPSLERSRLEEASSGWATTLVAVLLLGACVARTGLVPAHRWLPETAEAPSPVSALLHAGVVNGAGVLVVLAWPLFTAAPLALAGLLAFGVVSMLMGAWASRVRADVKGRLACSTTTQMGYMCIQLGLGLPAAALMHLIGHGAYKSWLFLRAGGAVARNRAAIEPSPTNSLRRWVASATGAGLAALVGLPATVQLVATTGLTVLVPVALSLVAAGLAGHAVAGLDRVNSTVGWAVVTLAGLVAGLYSWGVLGSEKVLGVVFAAEAAWAPSIGAGLVAVVVIATVTLALVYRHLGTHPESAFAMRLLPTGLAPAARPWAARPHVHLDAVKTARSGMIERSTIITAVSTASTVVGPAWPLRNMVAANPLAGLESMSFDDALLIANSAHRVPGRPSLPYFLDLLDSGRISVDHLRAALEEVQSDSALNVPSHSVTDFITTSRALASVGTAVSSTPTRPPTVQRLCEALPADRVARVTTVVDGHTALWAQRAWATTGPLYNSGPDGPTVQPEPAGPWTRWRQAAAQTSYDRGAGIRGASAVVGTLPTDPAQALSVLVGSIGLPVEHLVSYLVATFASAPGWSGHAAWRARRQQDPSPLVEWAALKVAHDILFTNAFSNTKDGSWQRPTPGVSSSVDQTTDSSAPIDHLDQQMVTAHSQIWQRALEIGVEDWLLPKVVDVGTPPKGDQQNQAQAVLTATTRNTSSTAACTDESPRADSQSIWCIDVRSERVRRHLESLGHHDTYGYAGFFGAAVSHFDPDQVNHECCPALIEPAFTAREDRTPLHLRQVIHRTTTAVSRNPLGALVIAEAGGPLAALASSLTTVDPRAMRRLTRSWTQDPTKARPGMKARHKTHEVTGPGALSPDARRSPRLTSDLGLPDRVELAATALRSTGLTQDFAPVILICAHGSSPENNAFATAYDCGACGGNDGAVNAVLLVNALNDPAVREQLAVEGLIVPLDTVAVAAIHDTTTDRIDLLHDGLTELPDQTYQRLQELGNDLHTAGRRAAVDQLSTLPARTTRNTRPLTQRAADWSEPTPEWGLAGNAAIVIGPRRLTASAELDGRVFLHSYERGQDPGGAVLEQLLTAPLVVAQWINAQYYFSAVAPDTFGAGDKTTHNVVGDVGVLRGAHGDLATGLPWQALFNYQPGTQPDATNLAHEPVRLLALVAADPDQILQIVTRHSVLNQLVGNQWVHLICLDHDRTLRLHHDLTWQDWKAPSAAKPGQPRLDLPPTPTPVPEPEPMWSARLPESASE